MYCTWEQGQSQGVGVDHIASRASLGVEEDLRGPRTAVIW